MDLMAREAKADPDKNDILVISIKIEILKIKDIFQQKKKNQT
jgi:hypothetical protein